MQQENALGQFRGTKIPQNTKKIILDANCLPIAHGEYCNKLFMSAVSAIKTAYMFLWRLGSIY